MGEETFQTSEMSHKLGLISEVMINGYFFVHMRELCEDWQSRADAGDKLAADAVNAINTFHRLCAYIKSSTSSSENF